MSKSGSAQLKKINKYKQAEDALLQAYQLESHTRKIWIKNYGINVRIQIIGQGKPLLFIHGAPAAGSLWLQLVSLLPGYTCILLDRPGCGLSEKVSYHNLSRDGLTDMITAVIDGVLDDLQIKKLPAVGSSFGGYLSMLYTLRNPGRFTKLVLEGCPAIVDGMKIPTLMRAMLFPGLKWLVPRMPSAKFQFRQILKGLGHTYSVDRNLIPEIFIEWYVSLFNNTDTMKNELSMISKAQSYRSMNPSFILHDDEIGKIPEAVLWLWGEDDPFGGAALGERLHSKTKNSRIKFFENSGHLPWIDEPEKHAEEIKSFVNAAEEIKAFVK